MPSLKYDPSIRERMAIGFGLMLGLLLLLLALALLTLHQLHIIDYHTEVIIAERADEAVNIQTSFLNESIALHSFIATREPDYLKVYKAARQARVEALARLGGIPMTPDNALLFRRITSLAADFDRLSTQVVALAESSRVPGATDALENRLRAIRTGLGDATWQFTLLQRRERVAAAREAESIRAGLFRTICILASIILAIGLLVAWLTTQAVRRPARQLIEAIRSLEQGNYRLALRLARAFPQGDRALRNELHIVAGVFGRMAETIQSREAELAVKNRQLERQNGQLHAQGEQLRLQSEKLQAQNEELQLTLDHLQASEQALRRQGEALAEADRRKDEFLAMLAHELRNPLAAISNANYVLERGQSTPDKMQQMRGMISRQLRHLSRLIDDLLDVSRITRGKVALRREWVDLGQMVQHLIETSQEAAARAGLALMLTLPGEALTLQADSLRLEQMIANLLNNAIKFTEAGGRIGVDVQREADWAVVRVCDTGIGMAPQLLPHIFELFSQADSGIDRSKGGLGIGLTLVRSLAGMHGGSVEARSAGLGQGSEFILRLPLPSANLTSAKDDGSPQAAHG